MQELILFSSKKLQKLPIFLVLTIAIIISSIKNSRWDVIAIRNDGSHEKTVFHSQDYGRIQFEGRNFRE